MREQRLDWMDSGSRASGRPAGARHLQCRSPLSFFKVLVNQIEVPQRKGTEKIFGPLLYINTTNLWCLLHARNLAKPHKSSMSVDDTFAARTLPSDFRSRIYFFELKKKLDLGGPSPRHCLRGRIIFSQQTKKTPEPLPHPYTGPVAL